MLSDRDIRAYIDRGALIVRKGGVLGDRLSDHQFQPNSIDIHLGRSFICQPWPGGKNEMRTCDEKGGILLSPGERILATTLEWVGLPNFLAARIEGVSTQARRGIINQLAPLIPAGFQGEITLEIQNTNPVPVMLVPGEKIGQLTFELLTTPAERPYGHPDLRSKYQHQQGATSPREEAAPEYIAPEHRPPEPARG